MRVAQAATREASELTSSVMGGLGRGATHLRTTPVSWLAGLLSIAPVVPVLAGIVTLMLYVAAEDTGRWEIFGYTAAPVAATVLVLPLLFGRLATFESANSNSANELEARVEALNRRLTVLQPDDLSRLDKVAAYNDAVAFRGAIEITPGQAALRWALGYGYTNAWKNLHRAEDALMYLEPQPLLLGRAERDELRITGSLMSDKDRLLDTLRQSGEALYASEANTRRAARMRLSEVHRSVDEYRDSRWSALVRGRNSSNAGTICAGVVAYALLALAIIRHVDDHQMAVGASYYLMGALAGLLNRVFVEQGAELTVEDYGLSTARLTRTLLFSGLAAVGGVVVVAMIPAALNDVAPDAKFPALTSLFDLDKSGFRYVLAAVFGVSPELLLAIIHRQGELLKNELKLTEPANGPKPK